MRDNRTICTILWNSSTTRATPWCFLKCFRRGRAPDYSGFFGLASGPGAGLRNEAIFVAKENKMRPVGRLETKPSELAGGSACPTLTPCPTLYIHYGTRGCGNEDPQSCPQLVSD